MALSAEKKKRRKVFGQFYDFNESLLVNMKYGKDKVSEVAKKYEFVEKAIRGESVLTGEEGAFIAEYVKNIGKTDAKTQIDYLNERKSHLQKYRDKSEEEYKKYSSLYFNLSLMGGILVAVLLA